MSGLHGLARRRMLAIATLVGTVLAGCRASSDAAVQQVEGVIVDVQSRDIQRVDSFTVRDDRGRLWRFVVASEPASDPRHAITPGHLRTHMAAGDRIGVTFVETGEGLLAQQIDDMSRS